MRTGKDLRVYSMTWNMGGANQTVFKSPEIILPGIDTFDLVLICAQECPKKFKTKRASEIEQLMNEAGFTSIATEFLDMWEMFLLCFVKRDLFEQVANVSAMKLAKGAMKGMIGNKGCIAYNFTLMNRHFNVIATHLKHG